MTKNDVLAQLKKATAAANRIDKLYGKLPLDAVRTGLALPIVPAKIRKPVLKVLDFADAARCELNGVANTAVNAIDFINSVYRPDQ